jgi:hypothetical protein
MRIEKDNIWLLWPETLSEKMDIGSLNELYNGDKSFTIYIEISNVKKTNYIQSIFTILPNFLSVDFKSHNEDEEGVIIHYTISTDKAINYLERRVDYSDKYCISYHYDMDNKIFFSVINGVETLKYKLLDDESLKTADNCHLILGSSDFPKNLKTDNITEYDIDKMIICDDIVLYDTLKEMDNYRSVLKKNNVLGYYDFIEKTDYKIFDHSNNNNHIHLMINQ